MDKIKISIIGAGSMGTALSVLTANNVKEILLWSRRDDIFKNIQKYRKNQYYFPEVKLPENITPINDLKHIQDVDMIFLTIPSHAVRDIVKKIKKYVDKNIIIVNTAKGIEYPPLKRMSEVIIEELEIYNMVAVSGPNFADEIIHNMPTATTIASYNNDKNISNSVKRILETDKFLVEISDDIVGIELCGILKNIVAIAMGICESIGINDNAKYAVLTEGFREVKNVILSFGGKLETSFSFSGFGDLCLTSHSEKSRNRSIGLIYGKKMFYNDQNEGVLVEGKKSIIGIRNYCYKNDIRCDLINFVYEIIYNKNDPRDSFSEYWKGITI